jgi:hypothetical protein
MKSDSLTHVSSPSSNVNNNNNNNFNFGGQSFYQNYQNPNFPQKSNNFGGSNRGNNNWHGDNSPSNGQSYI